MEIVDFGVIAASRHAEAAAILRDALAHMPSAYNAPGEAEAEVASPDGETWRSIVLHDAAASLRLEALGLEIPLAEVFAGVEFARHMSEASGA